MKDQKRKWNMGSNRIPKGKKIKKQIQIFKTVS